MKRSKTKTGFAVALLSLVLTTPVMAQFGGTGGGGGGGGFGGTGGGGGGGFGGTGGGTGGSGTATNLGGTQGFSGQSLSTGIFTPTQAIFGVRSYGRTPFGSVDNLRGPGAGGGSTGGVGGGLSRTGSTSRTGQTRTTGVGGAGGLGGLGALGGLGLGGRNRQTNNLNQNANLQNQVRTRMSSSDLRTEIEVPTIPATAIMARMSRLPNSERYLSANVAVRGNVALINAPALTAKDADRLGRYLMLEPGIEDFEVVSAQAPIDNNPLD